MRTILQSCPLRGWQALNDLPVALRTAGDPQSQMHSGRLPWPFLCQARSGLYAFKSFSTPQQIPFGLSLAVRAC